MTPESFVEMVAPHLPIGPYTEVSELVGFTRELTLKRGGVWSVDCDPTEAAHLLIGAVVCSDVATAKCKLPWGMAVRVDDGSGSATRIFSDNTPISILRALLAARAEARKGADNG